MERRLLPCPFCGSEARVVRERTKEPFSNFEYLVQCTVDGICYGKTPRTDETGFAYAEDAIHKWNLRNWRSE